MSLKTFAAKFNYKVLSTVLFGAVFAGILTGLILYSGKTGGMARHLYPLHRRLRARLADRDHHHTLQHPGHGQAAELFQNGRHLPFRLYPSEAG